MRLSNGKLNNGTELNHSPPFYMQGQPSDTELVSVRKQIFTWHTSAEHGLSRSIINTESALEIASWWSNPGNAFLAFTVDGTISPDLESEINEEEKKMAHESSKQALRALQAYIRESSIGRKSNAEEETA